MHEVVVLKQILASFYLQWDTHRFGSIEVDDLVTSWDVVPLDLEHAIIGKLHEAILEGKEDSQGRVRLR